MAPCGADPVPGSDGHRVRITDHPQVSADGWPCAGLTPNVSPQQLPVLTATFRSSFRRPMKLCAWQLSIQLHSPSVPFLAVDRVSLVIRRPCPRVLFAGHVNIGNSSRAHFVKMLVNRTRPDEVQNDPGGRKQHRGIACRRACPTARRKDSVAEPTRSEHGREATIRRNEQRTRVSNQDQRRPPFR